MLLKELDIFGLAQIISFGENLLLHLVNSKLRNIARSLCGFRESAKQLEIVFYCQANAGILNLHGHSLTVASDRVMHLTERSRGKGLWRKVFEYLFRFASQTSLDLHA